jgi:hypothetical protein
VPGKNLTRDEARQRADLLSVATYDVALDLTTGPATFRTRSTVDFTAAQEGASTFIDLIAASVELITLNGESLDPAAHFDGVRVLLPGLHSGANSLTIEATGVYMNTGEGLHRFVDPVDDEVYLYTQFEVLPANVRRFRTARPEGGFQVHGDCPRALAGRLQRTHAPAGPRRSEPTDANRDLGFCAHSKHLLLHHRTHRRTV